MSQNPNWVEARDGAKSAVMRRTAHHSTTSPVLTLAGLAEQVPSQEGWEHGGCGRYDRLGSQVSGFGKRACGQTGVSSGESD